ncbi:MAG: TIGR00730 family Rossman fold protein [Terriglobales bacterium]
MPLNLCVFCSSSDVIEPDYFRAATELGHTMAQRGDVLVYGGTNAGLMGAVARAMHRHAGRVVGVIPGFMAARGLAYAPADELIVTKDIRERKARMEDRADAFIALPGGFGTLEEMLEIITLKQLQRHSKPVIFLNTGGFYDPLIALFEHMREHRFAKQHCDSLYYFAPDVPALFIYLDHYRPPKIEAKWFVTTEP